VGCVVSEEKYALTCGAEVVDKADSEIKNVVAEVDGSVHIEDIELFVLNCRRVGVLEVHNLFLHYVFILFNLYIISSLVTFFK